MSQEQGERLDRLRAALANATSLPTLDEVGGPQLLADEQATLLASGALPEVVGIAAAALQHGDEPVVRNFVLAAATAANDAATFSAVTQVLLTDPATLTTLGSALVDAWLQASKDRTDVTGGMALEAAARLTLAGVGSRYALLDRLVRLREELPLITDDYAALVVRVAGAVAEHIDVPELAILLETLLSRDDVSSDAAFELGMLRLRHAVATPNPDAARDLLLHARTALADASTDEDRTDAVAFGAALDALLAFMGGALVPTAVVDQLRQAVFTFRLDMIGMPAGWRTPRFDTTAEWLRLVETLERAQAAHRPGAWLHAGAILNDLVAVYSAHRSLHLFALPDGRLPTATSSASALASPTPALPGLHAVLAPSVEHLLLAQQGGLALLEEWLEELSSPHDTDDDPDATVVREQANALRSRLAGGGGAAPPKDARPVPHSGLAGLLGVEDAAMINQQLCAMPQLTRRLDLRLAARDAAAFVDESPELATQYRRVRRELAQQCPGGYVGQFAADVDRFLLILLRFVNSRLQETQGFRGDASKYLRRIRKGDHRPHEKELGRDLRDYLGGQGLRVHLEVSNIGEGRVDLAWQPHDEVLTVELKRDWEDVSWPALEREYLPQVVAYQTGGPPLNFFMVLDLTDKPNGLAALPACIEVRTVAGPAGDPRARTVVMLRIQGNKRDPNQLTRSCG